VRLPRDELGGFGWGGGAVYHNCRRKVRLPRDELGGFGLGGDAVLFGEWLIDVLPYLKRRQDVRRVKVAIAVPVTFRERRIVGMGIFILARWIEKGMEAI
jgi:hypothetical protein